MDGMRLRLIGEIEELRHGARIELIAPLGPRRGESMRVLGCRGVVAKMTVKQCSLTVSP